MLLANAASKGVIRFAKEMKSSNSFVNGSSRVLTRHFAFCQNTLFSSLSLSDSLRYYGENLAKTNFKRFCVLAYTLRERRVTFSLSLSLSLSLSYVYIMRLFYVPLKLRKCSMPKPYFRAYFSLINFYMTTWLKLAW